MHFRPGKLTQALRSLAAVIVSMQIAAPAWATCGGGGGGGAGGITGAVYQVPWKLAKPGEAAPAEGWALFWFPLSANELKNSSLRTSRDLTIYASEGVTMFVADSTSPVVAKLPPEAKAPVAVLVNAKGDILGRADGSGGMLKAPVVEKLVKDQLKKLEDSLTQLGKDAAAKVKAKDNTGAVDIYKAIWAERALFPKKAKDAQAALKKLGVTIDDKKVMLPISAPRIGGAKGEEVYKVLDRGLKAELAGKYDEARSMYERAYQLDPGDPTTARFLGEFYRHVTGEWAKARQVFETMLEHPADPLSRAVALHGLGKMTIHEGEFEKGVRLIEDSVAEFPLALAYRNLAVYWNSEGNAAKTAHYVDEALKLEPDDAYNRIFAAVFYASSGRKDDALKLAKENESMLPASYNLAAIYAMSGDRDKALELLKRHFYEYERYAAVRSEEMMEARVDEVFASIRSDPDFLKLTALADGMLPMKMTGH